MTNSKQKHGEYIEYDDSGRIANIDWYTDGNHDCSLDVTDGKHSYKHGEENLWQKYTIKNGKPHGEWKIYHSNGEMNIYRKFNNGLKVGHWSSFHENGQQWSDENYVKGKRCGIFKKWRVEDC